MKILSVFVDESGDFGLKDRHSPYYIVTMVLHAQEHDITKMLEKLDNALEQLNYHNQAVHTEPLIRREPPYRDFFPNERRAILSKLYYFAISCRILYKSFIRAKAK